MISPEVFEYFKELGIQSGTLVDYDEIANVIPDINMETMSRFKIEEDQGEEFWETINDLRNKEHVQSVFIEFGDLFIDNTTAEEDEEDELSDEELLDLSQDAYIAAIYLITKEDDTSFLKQVKNMENQFSCEIFKVDEPKDLDLDLDENDKVWCIVWE